MVRQTQPRTQELLQQNLLYTTHLHTQYQPEACTLHHLLGPPCKPHRATAKVPLNKLNLFAQPTLSVMTALSCRRKIVSFHSILQQRERSVTSGNSFSICKDGSLFISSFVRLPVCLSICLPSLRPSVSPAVFLEGSSKLFINLR